MALFGLFRIAFRNLFVHRERLILLFAVVGGSAALLTFVIAVSAGAQAAHRRAITMLLSGEVSVGAFFKVHPDAIAPVVTDGKKVEALLRAQVPAGCELKERGRGYASVWSGKRRSGSFLIGVEPGNEKELFTLLAPEKGSLDALAEKGTVALSTKMAERLHAGVGDLVSVYVTTARGTRNGLDARVVAITPSVGLLGDSAGLLVGNALVRELYGYRPEAVSAVQVHCKEDIDAEKLGEAFRRTLRDSGLPVLPAERKAWADKISGLLREGWRGERFDVTTWEDEGVFLEFVTQGLRALTVLLGAVVMFVVVIGIFISLSVAVRERTREIGTLRAIGMQRASVVGLFVLEGLMMGASASAFGAIGSALACLLLKGRVHLPDAAATLLLDAFLPLDVRPVEVLLVIVVVSISAAVASVLPALRASSRLPRQAMESIL